MGVLLPDPSRGWRPLKLPCLPGAPMRALLRLSCARRFGFCAVGVSTHEQPVPWRERGARGASLGQEPRSTGRRLSVGQQPAGDGVFTVTQAPAGFRMGHLTKTLTRGSQEPNPGRPQDRVPFLLIQCCR